MDYRDALREAQQIHPLSLVARVSYITTMRDRGPAWSRDAWQKALDVTRNGTT